MASPRSRRLRPSRLGAVGALALALILALAGGAHARPRLAGALAQLGALADSSRLAAADSLATAVLAGALGTPGPLDSVAAIETLVDVRVDLGRAGSAATLALAERALAIRVARAPRDTLAQSRDHDLIGNVRFGLGDFARARADFELASRLRAGLAEDDPRRIQSVHNLARSAYALGDYAGARDGFQRAVALRERALGPRSTQLARSLNGLANTLSVLGDPIGALDAAERALAIREAVLPPDHPDVFNNLGVVARYRAELGDLVRAKALGERAVASAARAYGADSPLLAQPLTQLGNVLDQLGDDVRARACFERALAIDLRTYGPRHRIVVQAYDWLASALITHGDLDAAEPLVARGLALLDSIPDPSVQDRTALLTGRARLLMRRGHPAAAESVITEVLHIDERAFGPDHPAVARECVSVGAYRFEGGDPAGARPWFERAVAIYERSKRPDSLHLAIALDGLGTAQMSGGDTTAAARTLAHCLAIRERWLGPDHPDLEPTLDHLAILALRQRRPEVAMAMALRAESISREQLRGSAGASSEREALALAAGRIGGLDLAVDAATRPELGPDGRRAAWDALIRSRALVLDAIAVRTHTALEGDTLTARLRAARAEARRDLAAVMVRGPGGLGPARYQALVDHWRHEADLAERALLEASPEQAALERRGGLGFDAVAAALPAGSALVAYARYRPGSATGEFDPPRYAAFVLRAGARTPAVVPLGDAATLEGTLGRWDTALGQRPGERGSEAAAAERAARGAGELVRRAVWDPLVPALGGSARVFVVGDGALALTPFAALPEPGGRYLVERGPLLHVLTSERDLVGDPSRTRTGHGLLALGGAAFDSVATGPAPLVAAALPFRGLRARCAEFSRVRFAPLPGTAREVEDVAALWQAAAGAEEVRVLSGVEADEAGFERLAPGRRVLHLATHGFFVDPAVPPRRAAAAWASWPMPRRHPRRRRRRPRRRTRARCGSRVSPSPAPTGARTSRSAGTTASSPPRRWRPLDLAGVEWAVLSGCDTGVGRLLAGEGVLGLRRAFLVAGVRTVIMSLWPVEDAATRDWMVALYRHRLAEHLGTAESVRAAARDLIAARRARGLDTHPFRWAAFIAAGDWR